MRASFRFYQRLHCEGVGAVSNFADILQFEQIAGGRAVEDQVVEVIDGDQVAVVFHHNWIGVGLIA